MVKPFGALSLSSGSLSAAAGIGGGAIGASFFAPSVSGRPIKGEPGGNGAAGWADGVCCCAAAGGVAASHVPTVPASMRAHGRAKWVMMILPDLVLYYCSISSTAAHWRSSLDRQRAGLGRGIALTDLAPVDHVPPRLEVVAAAVLVHEIVGVLPHVVAEQHSL